MFREQRGTANVRMLWGVNEVGNQRLTVAFGNDDLNGSGAVNDFISIYPNH